MVKVKAPQSHSSNLEKHLSKDPLVKMLLNYYHSALFKLIKRSQPFSRLIDVGCGEGFTMHRLQNYFSEGQFSIIGCDINKKSLEFSKNINPNIPLSEENIYKLSFPTKEFDVVMCLEVLEHLENPKQALEELCRISKKYLLLSVPNEPFFSAAVFLRGKHIRRFGRIPEHLQFWTSRKFIKFISSKVEILEIKKPFPWTVILGKIKEGSN